MSNILLADVSVDDEIVVFHPYLGILRSGKVVEIIDGPVPRIRLLNDGRTVPGTWLAADMGLIEGKASVNKTYRRGEAPKSELGAKFRSAHEDIFPGGKPEDDPYVQEALNGILNGNPLAIQVLHRR